MKFKVVVTHNVSIPNNEYGSTTKTNKERIAVEESELKEHGPKSFIEGIMPYITSTKVKLESPSPRNT